MQKVYARQCDLRDISYEDLDIFLVQHHRQKTCNGQEFRYGLFFEDTLVGVMTFGKPRYNRHFQYELLRLCYHSEYQIVGGSERLLKKFIEENKPVSILSYCDKRYYKGEVYERLGFKKLYDSPPQKIWVKGGKKITSNLLRQHGADRLIGTKEGKGSNNEEIMLREGWKFEEDAGQSVWVLEFSRGKVGYIYRTTNNIDAKTYIGQHYWCNEGVDPTYFGSGTKIRNAINKHGKDNFSIELVEECLSIFDLNSREIYYIRKEKELGKGEYNLRSGGFWGYTFDSEETKLKKSVASRAMWESEEYRGKHREAMERVYQDPDYLARRSATSKATWEDPKYRERMREIYSSVECMQNRSDKSKELWQDQRFRDNQIKVRTSEEFRDNQSKKSKELWQTEEHKKNHDDGQKKRLADEDLGKKLSDGCKKGWQNRESKKRRIEIQNSDEVRQKRSESVKLSHSNREVLDKISTASKELWKNPEHKEKMAAASKSRWNDPEYRERMSRIQAEAWERRRNSKANSSF